MQVEEVVPYDKYYHDSRFAAKIPDNSIGKVVYKCGDNIYKPLPNGDFQQLQSMHSNGTNENHKTKAIHISTSFNTFNCITQFLLHPNCFNGKCRIMAPARAGSSGVCRVRRSLTQTLR